MWAAILKRIRDYFISFALKTWGGVTGIKAKIVIYCGSIVYDFLALFVKNLKRKKEQEEALENLEKVDQDPKSTNDDKGKAYEDMFNSGR